MTTFDSRELRTVLGSFVTGVTVVTTIDDEGRAHGVTANSFSSVSLDPPLVLWSQALTSRSYPAFREAKHFAINVLADDQTRISNHFAKSGEDKFTGIDFKPGLGGAPLIAGCAAYLECSKAAAYPGGDHIVFLGHVEQIVHGQRRPLVFGQGRYMTAQAYDLGPLAVELGPPSPEHLDAVRMVTAAMPRIADELGHTVYCAAWANRGPTVLRWEPSTNPVSHDLRTGLVLSVTRSASGRLFAAMLPRALTIKYIEDELAAQLATDPAHAMTRDEFEVELAEASLHGIARAKLARTSALFPTTLNGFSAPVLDSGGRIVLALSVLGAASELDAEWTGPVPRALTAEAQALSSQLGWRRSK